MIFLQIVVNKLRLNLSGSGKKPVDLYFRGCFDPEMLVSCVAVVGSRRITEYGRQVIRKLIPNLVSAGKIIVSGLMYGVDQTVHKECMVCGGRTVAVLGWGINWFGAGEDEKNLADEIEKSGGAVVSEWLEEKPNLWMFPRRDMIMAAMATDIFVVEGAMKSGSLITADWGKKLGKTVWAVPGPITSKVSEGTNWLIATGRAKMWLPQQQLNLRINVRNDSNTDTDINRLLQNEILSIDEIAVKLKRSVETLGAELTMMQLRGEVEEKEGKYYIVI